MVMETFNLAVWERDSHPAPQVFGRPAVKGQQRHSQGRTREQTGTRQCRTEPRREQLKMWQKTIENKRQSGTMPDPSTLSCFPGKNFFT